ncbi:MAG: GNAT family N-acetyltransferase [Chloroflexota bacterium]|jgi:GNAT superfamily N-acetyltransferase
MNQVSEQLLTANTEGTAQLGDTQSNSRSLTGKEKTMTLEVTKLTASSQRQRFTFRPAMMEDLEEAVDLFNLCSMHKIGKPGVTFSEVRAEWLLPDFDLETSTRVACAPDGRLIGYIEVWDGEALPVDIWVWGRVHPDYEGLGIGTALMDWAEERARQAVAKVPDELQVIMRSGSIAGYEPAETLLEDRGMTLIRSFYTMVLELDQEPPRAKWPLGITVRPTKGLDEARKVFRAVDDAFRDHWGYVEQPFEQEFERWFHFMKNDEHFDPNLWFLAMDGDEIAGVSLCTRQSREDKNMGWIRVLGVRRPWRRQGLGLALLHHSFSEFQRLGKARVGLGVDASSLTGATRLYEKAGMKPVRQFDSYRLVLRAGRDISTQQVEE